MERHYTYLGEVIADPNWEKFENFFADMGAKPDSFTLDRIDVNRDYEPENCRYVPFAVQATNKRLNVKNKSGIEGVWWDSKKKRYVVKICVNNLNRHIGTFTDFFEACCAQRSSQNFFRQALWN